MPEALSMVISDFFMGSSVSPVGCLNIPQTTAVPSRASAAGEIPHTLGLLGQLQVLDLSNNDLEGQLMWHVFGASRSCHIDFVINVVQ